MIKNIIFDMGNVLLSYDPEISLNYYLDKDEDKAVIRRELFEGEEWEMTDRGELTDEELFCRVKERVPEHLHGALNNCVRHWMMCMFPVPGALDFCRDAKLEGMKIYVLSNAGTSFYEYFPRFALLSFFDGIVVSCDIHQVKPEPGIYQYLLDTYRLKAEECFFIDDRSDNVEAAERIGIQGTVFDGCWDKVREELGRHPGGHPVGKLCSLLEEMRQKLRQSAEEGYKDFNASIVPGGGDAMLGVRIPALRELAKKAAKEYGYSYLSEIEKAEQEGNVYHEELLLHGLIIGYLKCGTEERKVLLNRFVPAISNWAVCDSSCMTYKFMKKNPEEWFSYLVSYTESRREYEIRFGIVCMLDHFVTEDYVDAVLKILEGIRHEGYYVKMAAAWAVSVCYVKFPERTKYILLEGKLDDFTHNKSIQKIRESYRVSKEEKEFVKSLKRK